MTDADIVLRGGAITTMSDAHDKQPTPSALAIVGNRITALGDESSIESWITDETTVIDLDGRRVIPGLIDAHVHFARAGFTWNDEVRWGDAGSLTEALGLVEERTSQVPPGTWISVIGGWSPAQFSEDRELTQADLDRVAPDHPVFVQYLYDWGMLNEVGQAQVPLDRAIAEGVDPATVDVDAEGRPIGVVRTLPSLRWLYSQLPAPDFEAQVASTIAAGKEFARYGITGVIDGGGANTGPDVYRPIFETWRRGALVPRVRLTMHSTSPGEEKTDIGGYVRFNHPRSGDRFLSTLAVGEIVCWAFHDGVLRSPDPSQDDLLLLESLFRSCAEAGWTVQMHAIRPETTETVIGTWEKIHSSTPIDSLRWAIVHGESVTVDHAERLAALGAGVICEAILRLDGDTAIETWGADRVATSPDIRTIQEAGARVAAGSDGLRAATYNPFATLQWLVTGKSLRGTQVWDKSNVLDRREALALQTREAAWFSFEEADRGQLQPGYLADLAVLNDDYFEVPDDDLPSLRSVLTIIDGKVVWDENDASGIQEK